MSTHTVREFLVEGEVAGLEKRPSAVLLSIGDRWFTSSDRRVGEVVARGSFVRLLVRAATDRDTGEILILQSELLPPTYVGPASGAGYGMCAAAMFAVGLYLLSVPILISSAITVKAHVWLTRRREEAFRVFATLCSERLGSPSIDERKSRLAVDEPRGPRELGSSQPPE